MKLNHPLMLTLFLFHPPVKVQAAQHRRVRFPIWLYTAGNSDIYGLSVGIGSDTYQNSGYVGVRSNGIRIEPVSQSLLLFTVIFPVDRVKYPTDPSEYTAFAKKMPNEVINGLNISCGTNAFADVNGATLSLLTQSFRQVNGLSVAGCNNYSFINNGLQIASGIAGACCSNGILLSGLATKVHTGRGLQLSLFTIYSKFTGFQAGAFNGLLGKAEEFTGLQFGLINAAKKLRGIQIGLINKNEKRILPFINWNFKD